MQKTQNTSYRNIHVRFENQHRRPFPCNIYSSQRFMCGPKFCIVIVVFSTDFIPFMFINLISL